MRKSSGLRVGWGGTTLFVEIGSAQFWTVVDRRPEAMKWYWFAARMPVRPASRKSKMTGFSPTWQAAQRAAFRACESLARRRR